MMLVHARAASKGVGEPECNENNHPFVNHDRSVGLVHNGRIEDYEYNALKIKYEVHSDCDSEILLRIFENYWRHPGEWIGKYDNRLAGISDIFSLINDGHMAVAIGERRDNNNLLWLFRNRHRPLWVVDMRELLGQVFFVSEPRIWETAVRACGGFRNISQTQKLIELPVEEVWFFKADDNTLPTVQRYEVEKSDDVTPWSFDGERVGLTPNPKPVNDELRDIGKNLHELVEQVIGETQSKSLLANEYQEVIDRLDNVKRELAEVYNCLSAQNV